MTSALRFSKSEEKTAVKGTHTIKPVNFYWCRMHEASNNFGSERMASRFSKLVMHYDFAVY
jgi:hypothetical protein